STHIMVLKPPVFSRPRLNPPTPLNRSRTLNTTHSFPRGGVECPRRGTRLLLGQSFYSARFAILCALFLPHQGLVELGDGDGVFAARKLCVELLDDVLG